MRIRTPLLLLVFMACSEPEQERQPETRASDAVAGSSSSSAAPAPSADAEPAGTGLELSDPGTGGPGPRDPRRPSGHVVRMGVPSVTGALPPEVVQRVLRQNYARFRACYQKALETQPKLSGTVTTTFTIDADGALLAPKASGNIADKQMLPCVQGAFEGVTFPKPEQGTVKVRYPLSFAPGAYKFKIGEKSSVDASEADVFKALEAAGYRTTGASSAAPPTAVVSRFKAEKGGLTLSLTLDPAAKLPVEEYLQLKDTAVMLEDGIWVLFVESSDPAQSRKLLDAIHKKLPAK